MSSRPVAMVLCLAFLLGGCAVNGGSGSRHHPTLASLDRKRVEVEPEQSIDNAREKAAATYRRALEASANPQMEAEALRRLADLELQRAEEALLDSEIPPNGGEFVDAIESYRALLKNHPDKEGNDRVLYQLARAQENAADQAAALASLDRLVSKYPASSYMQEAQFRRGEMLFMARKYRESELAYEAVIVTGATSAFYAPALYKHGWCLFKQSLHDEALGSFFDLMDHKLVSNGALVTHEAMSRPEQELMEDTLRAVSISLSYFPGHDEVGAWLTRRNPVYYHRVYASLADLYFSQERYADAAQTARDFVLAHPSDPRAPSFQSRVISTWNKGGFPGREREAKADFVDSYLPGTSFWSAHDAAAMPDVLRHVQSYLLDLAEHHHSTYQKLASKPKAKPQSRDEAATQAVTFYQRALQHFPNADEAGNTSFLLAELLFDTQRFAEAAAAYEQAAYRYASFERQAEAAYAALLAYDQHAETLAGSELEAWREQGLESALKFAARFPGNPEANVVLTRSAEEVFVQGDLDYAIELTERVLNSAEAVSEAVQVTALTVSGHARFDKADYAGAQRAYQEVLALVDAADGRHADLTERLASSIYKQGEISRDGGDLAAAAAAFGNVAVLTPGSTIRPLADYDAAAMQIQLEHWQTAADELAAFLTHHPGHELAPDAQRQLVIAYQKSGQSIAAAGELEKMSGLGADADAQEAALWQAAELYREAGATRQAVAAFEVYVARFPDHTDAAMEARQSLVDLHARAGSVAEVARWQKAIVRADAAAGETHSPRSRTLAAHAALALAGPAVAAYGDVRLVVPLKKSLKEKKRRMERALQGLAVAAALGISEVTTNATYQTAAIYREMGSALMESERPRGLSAEQLEQYEIVLEEQAFPFEEKAIELHEVNVARIGDAEFDEWIQASIDALAELMPARYAKHEISENAVAQIH